MSKIPLYTILQKQQSENGCILASGLDEGQMLLCGGRPMWQAGDCTALLQNLPAIQSCTVTGIQQFGQKRVFIERFGAVPQLVVCGGGHVALSVVRFAKLLGLHVLAMDDREEYAQQLREAGADNVLCQPFEDALAQVPGGAETYFVVVTRTHAFDVVCLKHILCKPAAYVGMMGSRGRSALVRRQLLEQGIDAQRVEALFAPIGLSIGSQTAEEIALSILAQIVSIKNNRLQTEGFSPALLQAMETADKTEQNAVLATIIARHGSTPREAGAKMLVLPDGTAVGSVGGGIMEHQTILAAQTMLSGKGPCQQVVHFSADGKNDDAALAACGGSMELLLKLLEPGEELL